MLHNFYSFVPINLTFGLFCLHEKRYFNSLNLNLKSYVEGTIPLYFILFLSFLSIFLYCSGIYKCVFFARCKSLINQRNDLSLPLSRLRHQAHKELYAYKQVRMHVYALLKFRKWHHYPVLFHCSYCVSLFGISYDTLRGSWGSSIFIFKINCCFSHACRSKSSHKQQLVAQLKNGILIDSTI